MHSFLAVGSAAIYRRVYHNGDKLTNSGFSTINITTIQIAVNKTDCYQLLLPSGVVKKLEEGSVPPRWTTINKNHDNAQIVAADSAWIRRTDGNIYHYSGKTWSKSGTRANRFWGIQQTKWQWQVGSGTLWEIRPGTGWTVRDRNTKPVDIAFASNTLYQLREDGNVYSWVDSGGEGSWKSIDNNPQDTVEIAASESLLCRRHSNGQIFGWDKTQWNFMGNDKLAIQIAAGDGGIYKRRKDGSIYRWLNSESWESVDSSPDNSHIAVAKDLYRVTTKGGIYRLVEKSGVWEKLQETKSNEGVQPEAVYDGGFSDSSENIRIRIGNGGAGQSGLIEDLSDAFIQQSVKSGQEPFQIAWYKSDTTESIHYLKDGIVDIAITYTPAAEDIAMKQGIARNPKYYAFREHLMLVGPPSNPADLDKNADVVEMFSALYTAAEAANTKPLVRFLSRFDKSATNIKDSELWVKIGQVPWATAYSGWYHQYLAYPIQALTAAAALQEYTLTDYGTYLSADVAVEKQVTVYKKGTDNTDDPLLLPAHLLIGTQAKDGDLAKKFAEWVVSSAGQAVITSFKKNGQQVYSPGVQN